MRRRSIVRIAGSVAVRSLPERIAAALLARHAVALLDRNAIASSTERQTAAGVPPIVSRRIVSTCKAVAPLPPIRLTSIHRTSPSRMHSKSGSPARDIGPPCILSVIHPVASAALRIAASTFFSGVIHAPVVGLSKLSGR